MPFIPHMVLALLLAVGAEVYARCRGTTFVDLTMDRHWFFLVSTGPVVFAITHDTNEPRANKHQNKFSAPTGNDRSWKRKNLYRPGAQNHTLLNRLGKVYLWSLIELNKQKEENKILITTIIV
jgi:hypothetical protein